MFKKYLLMLDCCLINCIDLLTFKHIQMLISE